VRAVRLTGSAFDDIRRQLPPDQAEEFIRRDLRAVLDTLGEQVEAWDEATEQHGPARRLTVYGRTVAGFHLFGIEDPNDPRDGAIMIYLVDIWPDEFPE
jgi:hypothetical protein